LASLIDNNFMVAAAEGKEGMVDETLSKSQKKRLAKARAKARAKELNGRVWAKAKLSVGRESRLVSKDKVGKGAVLWATNEYYLSILYSNFCSTYCGSCYRELGASPRWVCKACGCFSLCQKCDREEAKRWHEHECKLFCGVPRGMRQGDTDYLRFVCRFFSICTHGPPPTCLPGSRLTSPTKELDEIFKLRCQEGGGRAGQFLDCLATNKELQSEDFRSWCSNFAQLFKQHVEFPKGYEVGDLCDLLMRIRTNGLGFPCDDKHGTLGWSLDLYASFLDHSCSPNCEVVMDDGGKLLVRTLSDVPAGGQLLITYVDVKSRTPQERKDHLFDLYRFRCSCERCKRGE